MSDRTCVVDGCDQRAVCKKMCQAHYERAYRKANREKVAERHRVYRDANREKVAATNRAYREANREKVAELQRAWGVANAERLAEQARLYYLAHRQEYVERSRVYRETNREKIAADTRAYRAANPEKVASIRRAWREAHKEELADKDRSYYENQAYGGVRPVVAACARCGEQIDLTVRDRTGRRRRATTRLCRPCRTTSHKASVFVLAKRDGTDCGICGERVDMALRRPDVLSPSVDHVMPRACGGSDEPGNLQLAHLRCNMVKQDKLNFTF